ncbi:MAG TPA: TetR/AcrR family transcriptional regulator [Aeromicrobium sp.]|nr:TetR/AcrR family transcriptional regulator [Aeromicrobium sp.]
MSEVVRPYRGVSADERRRQRREQLLDACLDVVGEVGPSATTVEAVCKRAGLSKRYFYESFADREAVLVALVERVMAAVREALEAVVGDPSLSPDEQMRRLVHATVDTLAADARISRLWVEASLYPALEQRRSEAYDDFAAVLARILLPDRADDEETLDAFLLVVAGTTEILRRGLRTPSPEKTAEMVEVLHRVGSAIRAAFA